MSDTTEQRLASEAYSPEPNTELHKLPVLDDTEELIEMSEEFNLEEFQVVRREFFAHTHEPAVTFNNRKFYVNSACLNRFPNTSFVQALINPHTKILALRPCGENERGSFQWCSMSQGKRKPRQTTCTLFFLKMFDIQEGLACTYYVWSLLWWWHHADPQSAQRRHYPKAVCDGCSRHKQASCTGTLSVHF
ncbi:hypothetical protein [Ruthenibacterium lactatiformans]|uniref:hypothetical protein n=1 Tax=Ruthenibacterium lactatiformans TaxID=1550024 RepID=UPI001FA95241|nr:hypothetical protein [Ruthenibacterium lactatiformans]